MQKPYSGQVELSNKFARTTIWGVALVDAPEIVTSAWIDEQLRETFERCAIRPGPLESVAGIIERRWWTEGVTFNEVAALAGRQAIRSPLPSPASWAGPSTASGAAMNRPSCTSQFVSYRWPTGSTSARCAECSTGPLEYRSTRAWGAWRSGFGRSALQPPSEPFPPGLKSTSSIP